MLVTIRKDCDLEPTQPVDTLEVCSLCHLPFISGGPIIVPAGEHRTCWFCNSAAARLGLFTITHAVKNLHEQLYATLVDNDDVRQIVLAQSMLYRMHDDTCGMRT